MGDLFFLGWKFNNNSVIHNMETWSILEWLAIYNNYVVRECFCVMEERQDGLHGSQIFLGVYSNNHYVFGKLGGIIFGRKNDPPTSPWTSKSGV